MKQQQHDIKWKENSEKKIRGSSSLWGWLAASWYALKWQPDAVSEFMCASHYLAV